MAEKKYKLPYPEALFDLPYFKNNPRPFFEFSRELFQMDNKPGKCHSLVADLEQQGKVSLVVTQNIDRLHQNAGTRNIIACHGTYDHAHCQGCGKTYDQKDIEKEIQDGLIPKCECGGVIKPDIVFFGEALPQEFYRILETPPEADLILILGTSLNVQPACVFALDMVSKVPSIMVNLDETRYDRHMDVALHMDLEKFAESMYTLMEQTDQVSL